MTEHDIEVPVFIPEIFRALFLHDRNPSKQFHPEDVDLFDMVSCDPVLASQRESFYSRAVFEVRVVVDSGTTCDSQSVFPLCDDN